MLIDLKSKLNEPTIRELFAYSVFPDPERLDQVIYEYREDEELQLFGFQGNEDIIGVVGCKVDQMNRIEIKHLAVQPEYRGLGYGRGMLLELINLKNPQALIAETDEEAVEFYRNVGFSIISLGEEYPDKEKFRCTFQTEEEE